MQHLRSFALRADYEGSVEVDGEPRPIFQGGLLAVGDNSDFDVAEALKDGDGVITIHRSDTILEALLDAYPALKDVTVPDAPAAIVSPYARRQLDDIRQLASIRDIEHAGSASKEHLVEALELQDRLQRDGAAVQVDGVFVEPTVDAADPQEPELPPEPEPPAPEPVPDGEPSKRPARRNSRS